MCELTELTVHSSNRDYSIHNNLITLRILRSTLTQLPEFPDTLEELEIVNESSLIIPKLPKNLRILKIYGYRNTTYGYFEHMKCDKWIIPSLEHLVHLETLSIRRLNISELPKLPPSLVHFECICTNLTYLPDLPISLKRLVCMENRLIQLPELPEKLEILECSKNSLIEIPQLPNELKHLYCHKNNIRVLPYLPSKLEILTCCNNPLGYNVTRSWYGKTNIENFRQMRIKHSLTKFRKKLIEWLWRARNSLAKIRYHPYRINEVLNRGIDIDDLELYI